MEIFQIDEFLKRVNPEPGKRTSQQILENKAATMSGMFVTVPSGVQGPYHFHAKRESIIIIIQGKGKELLEGKQVDIKKNDVIFIPAGQKHGMVNDGQEDLLFIEFQTGNPKEPDMVPVEWQEAK